ncbi:DUF4352 domain-containing protein [Enterococcus faecium]
MKHLTLGLSALFMGLLLTGCGGHQATPTTTTTTSSEVKEESVIVNGLELTLSGFSQKEMVTANQKKQQVYVVHVKGKNVSSSDKGLGAIDFVLKTTDGKTHQVTSELASFGNELQNSKSIEGDLYYSLSKNEKPKMVEYKPTDKVLYSWKATK